MTAVYTTKTARDGVGNSFNAALQDQDGTGASVAGVHALRDSAGANVNPATSDLQTAANVSLSSIATNTAPGAAITGAAMPSGGVGALGWLSAIWSKLSGTLSVSAASLPLPTGAALEAGGNLAAISAAAGTQADAAYSGSGSGSPISLLKWIGAALKGTLSVSWAGLTVADGQTETGIAAVGKMLFNGTTYDRQRSGVLIGSALMQPIDGTTGTGSVSSAAVLFSLDTAGYAGVSVLATSMPASNLVTFEGSNDNTNWSVILAQSTGNSGYPPSATAMAIGVPAWFIPAVTRYIRARVSTYASGTISVAYALRSSSTTLATIGAQTGGGSMATRASGNYYGGLTKARIQSLATTNSTLVKGSPGQPYAIDVGNNGASDAWLKLYDKAAAPTVGTDTPVASIYLPKGTARTIIFTDIGVVFSNGIGYGLTGAAIDTDTTAVAVNQVTGILAYT